jgi:predicted glycoside hydrolase/deacetylase ChbG (UPF0249 family)
VQLIVNADDFGLSSGVNRGVIDCHQAGSVTSTTLMVTMPAVEEAVELAKAHPSLGVGLHFNLTLGDPLSPLNDVPSLVNRQGQFYRRPMAEKRAMVGLFKPAEVAQELLAQFNCFMAFGLTPTHIDSHQHIHVFPIVFDVLAKFCANHDLPLRVPWVARQYRKGLRRHFRAWILARLLKHNKARWSGGVKLNSGFGSVFDLISDPGEIALETYKQILRTNNAGPFELMVHPAYIDKELAGLTRITAYSERERAVLSDRRFAETAAALGWKLVSYRRAFL